MAFFLGRTRYTDDDHDGHDVFVLGGCEVVSVVVRDMAGAYKNDGVRGLIKPFGAYLRVFRWGPEPSLRGQGPQEASPSIGGARNVQKT